MKSLYLFDIDGTLVDLTEVHVAAYNESYTSLFNRTPQKDSLVSKFGKAEEEVQREIFKEMGFDPKRIKELVRLYQQKVCERIKSDGDDIVVLPGVRAALDYFLGSGDSLGVITGNLKDVGETILEKTRLLKYFSYFGYAEGETKREDIVQKAITMAKHNESKFDRVVIVGDSPSDIMAAKKVGAFSVAVATGHHPRQDLRKMNPDLVLATLEEYRKILKIK